MTKTTTEPVCMYFIFAKSTSHKDEYLEGTDKIRPQYAHERTYDGMTQKIPFKDTIVSLPEEKRTTVSMTANVESCMACAHAL